MSDGVIKLFGKRILLQPVEEEKVPNTPNCKSHELINETKNLQKDLDDSANLSTPVQPENPESALTTKEGEEDSNDTSSENSKEGDDKSSLKKPDKILPCPRCHSMDTKFCYFNNYNVNQPRHFCKNCQRYWTAGGSMRNVPIGAGRRKSKSNPSSLPGSHFYRSLPVPNTLLQPLQSNSLGSKVNGSATVLSFGSEPNPPLNGFRIVENGDENSSISSVEVSKPKDGEKKMDTMNTGAASTNGTTPWPYAWGPVPAMYNGSAIGVQIYPYWGCIPLTNGAWTIPWTGGACTGPVTLGKHSRDGSTLNSEARRDGTKDNKIWVPKTLRIDNPEEAAKSSMWAMVAAHNEKADKIGGQITKMFEPKGEVKDSMLKKPHMLIANPAALARSVNFHESA